MNDGKLLLVLGCACLVGGWAYALACLGLPPEWVGAIVWLVAVTFFGGSVVGSTQGQRDTSAKPPRGNTNATRDDVTQ